MSPADLPKACGYCGVDVPEPKWFSVKGGESVKTLCDSCYKTENERYKPWLKVQD